MGTPKTMAARRSPPATRPRRQPIRKTPAPNAAPARLPPAAACGDPVFLLVAPRSCGSLLAAMLGQHPQGAALPETHLFLAKTVGEWWDLCANSSPTISHGLLRAVAQLIFGSQNERTVQLASGWLRRRLPFPTGYVFEVLAGRVHPRVLVERSATMAFKPVSMQRAQRLFPEARFIHLVEHPHTHGLAVVATVRETLERTNVLPRWLRQLACFSGPEADEHSQEHPEIDPQQAWLALHRNIGEFLETIPVDRQLLVRAEDVLASPDATLATIVKWVGLPADPEAIEMMKHPERSPFACFGPPGARFGDNPQFLRSPTLPAPASEPPSLDTPLGWRADGEGLSPAVKALARRFGYD